MIDVGLYVHVPFCRRKCDYCDFYSHVPDETVVRGYIEALKNELRTGPAGDDPRVRVKTIFVGGGTPTALSESDLKTFIEPIAMIVQRDAVEEFTVEANPATLDESKAGILKAAGVNRLSIGVQSFNPRELETLGRIHRPEDVSRTVEQIRRAGFDHLNCDLIFGIPGQTEASWSDTLKQTVDLGGDHIACYSLTYEAGTPLRRRIENGSISRLDEDLEADLYELAISRLAEAGFVQYEISNFAVVGAQCRHNLSCWRNEPYVGVGPSAAGYLNGVRYRNIPDTAEYVRRVQAGLSPVCEEETLDAYGRAGETAMLALRMSDGIDCSMFIRQTGFDPLKLFQEVIRNHVKSGHIAATSERIRLTRQGLLVADCVMADFLSAASQAGR